MTGATPPRAARLYGLGTALPKHSASQTAAARFMIDAARASGPDAARSIPFIERIYAGSGILTRHSVIEDFIKENASDFRFFPPRADLEPFPSTARRMDLFERESPPLAEEAGRAALRDAGIAGSQVTHVVLTTCTGFVAPGLDSALIELLGLPRDVQRVQIGFMGCYAGFTAMKTARAFVAADPEAVVLVVAVELCSIHFQKRTVMDYIISNSLFADGAGAAIFAAPGALRGGYVDLVATHSMLAPDSRDQMSWRIGDTGFEMRLDRGVPDTIQNHAAAFVDVLLARAGFTRQDARGWAPHPGGRRVISAIAEALSLNDDDLRSSLGVLADCGNMSSATIFFVLARQFARPAQGPTVALGFGPGLTMEGAVFVPLP